MPFRTCFRSFSNTRMLVANKVASLNMSWFRPLEVGLKFFCFAVKLVAWSTCTTPGGKGPTC